LRVMGAVVESRTIAVIGRGDNCRYPLERAVMGDFAYVKLLNIYIAGRRG